MNLPRAKFSQWAKAKMERCPDSLTLERKIYMSWAGLHGFQNCTLMGGPKSEAARH
jgi:hypothetical protein